MFTFKIKINFLPIKRKQIVKKTKVSKDKLKVFLALKYVSIVIELILFEILIKR